MVFTNHRASIAFAVALLISACGTTKPNPAPIATNQAASTATKLDDVSQPTNTALPEPTLAPAKEGDSRSKPAKMGTELKGKTWSITIENVIRGQEAAQALAKANQFNDPAKPGNVFLIANLTLKNISKEQKAQSTSFAVNLNVTGDQNISYRAIPAVPPEPLKGELFPDGTAKGQVVFEVPASEKNLMFIVTESMSFDTNLRQFIAIDPDASITPDPSLRKVAPTDIGRKRDTPAKIGETLVAGQWEFSILQTVRDNDAATLITEANQFNDPAPADQEYVAIRFKARYLGTDDPDRSENISGTFLKITGEKNVVYEYLPVVPPKPNIDSMLFAGGSAEGWTVASVSKGEKGLKLIFEPLFSFGQDNIRFITIE